MTSKQENLHQNAMTEEAIASAELATKPIEEECEKEFDTNIPQYAHKRIDRNGDREFLASEVSRVKAFIKELLSRPNQKIQDLLLSERQTAYWEGIKVMEDEYKQGYAEGCSNPNYNDGVEAG